MKTKGIIYRLITDDRATGKFKIYVGATTHAPETRLSQHKSDYELYKQGKHNYVASFEIIKCSWYEMCIEEEIEFDNFNELLQAERRAYDKFMADEDYTVVNVNVPARDTKEYYSSAIGRESIKRYHHTEKGRKALAKANKKYYQKNRAKKIEKMKANYQKKKALMNENAPPKDAHPANSDAFQE